MVRGQGTEFDSLREYVVGDDVRSIDWRATARAADVVVRTWRPERDRRVLLRARHRPHRRRPGSATPPGWTPRWTPRCCWPRWPPAPATGSTCSPTTGRSAPASKGSTGAALLPALVAAMAPLEPTLVEPDYAGMVRTVLPGASRRASSCC